MDYINYVKQAPVQGLTGLWGGTQGALIAGSSGVPFVTGGDRGMWGGGNPDEMPGPGSKSDDGGFKVIDYVNITSTGDASDFGRLTTKTFDAAAVSNQSRGVWIGGGTQGGPTVQDVMQYVTISSTGNATDFGNAISDIYSRAGCSDGSEGNRGLYWGGYSGPSGANGNVIGYINISSTGNASDFGDTLTNTGGGCAFADNTRGCYNGSANGWDDSNVIQYVTIQTTGNATDFGDMVVSTTKRAGSADSTRGVAACGDGPTNAIDYVTIQTLGNASDFGNSQISTTGRGGCSNETRTCFAGGEDTRGIGGNPPQVGYKVIDYITTQTTGNGTNFGDLIIGRRQTPQGLAGNT